MGFMFCDLHVSLNYPSSGDINSSNLPCVIQFIYLQNDTSDATSKLGYIPIRLFSQICYCNIYNYIYEGLDGGGGGSGIHYSLKI